MIYSFFSYFYHFKTFTYIHCNFGWIMGLLSPTCDTCYLYSHRSKWCCGKICNSAVVFLPFQQTRLPLWHFWPTVLSVVPLARCVVCRLSVCLSVCLSSVTFCIVAKRYVLAKKYLKEWIGNHGQKVHFLGRRHISTSGFATIATQTAVFALFLPIQPNDQC